MWVLGWYMPGTNSPNAKLLGNRLAAASTASGELGSSCTLGPNKASSPRPRPLGFLVTMLYFSFK
jgi:hypothetical protein